MPLYGEALCFLHPGQSTSGAHPEDALLLALLCPRCPQAQAGNSPGGRAVYHLLSTYCVLVVTLIPDQLSSGTPGQTRELNQVFLNARPSFTGSRVPSHCLSLPPSSTGCHLGLDTSFRVPGTGGAASQPSTLP